MTLPLLPLIAFPNQVTIWLCDDQGNREGGFNPVKSTSATLNASVQDKGQSWDSDRNLAINAYRVSFRSDPSVGLARPIRNGDEIDWAGLALVVRSSPNNRGGVGLYWRTTCETIES